MNYELLTRLSGNIRQHLAKPDTDWYSATFGNIWQSRIPTGIRQHSATFGKAGCRMVSGKTRGSFYKIK